MLIHLIGRNPGSFAAEAAITEYLAVADKDGAFLTPCPACGPNSGTSQDSPHTQWEVFIALHLGIPVFVYGDDSHADPAHPQRQHLDRLVKARRYSDTFIAFLGHLPRPCKALLTSRPLVIATGRRLKLQQRVTATA